MKRFLERIEHKQRDYRASGPVVIVAFGDSVTMGATSADRFEPDAVYHNRLKRMLEERYPTVTSSVINAGIGGDNAAAGVQRLQRDVLRYQPDLVLIAFGLNDASDQTEGIERFRSNMQQIVRRIRGETIADVVLLTPTFMASRPNTAILPSQHELLDYFIRLQTEGHLARVAQVVRDLAAEEGVDVADVYAAWQRLSEQGTDTTAMLANGLNHPTGEAHQIAADVIMKTITPNTNRPM